MQYSVADSSWQPFGTSALLLFCALAPLTLPLPPPLFLSLSLSLISFSLSLPLPPSLPPFYLSLPPSLCPPSLLSAPFRLRIIQAAQYTKGKLSAGVIARQLQNRSKILLSFPVSFRFLFLGGGMAAQRLQTPVRSSGRAPDCRSSAP